MLGYRLKVLGLLRSQPVFPPAMRRNQGAMHNQVGIAADGRGEMGVTLQVKPKMPKVFRAVIGLSHRAQHDHVDQLRMLTPCRLIKQAVELRGGQPLALGQHHANRLHGLVQGLHFVGVWLFMHAVNEIRLGFFQRFSGADIGHDHKLFHQLMGVKPLAKRHRGHHAFIRQHNLPLGQIKMQRLALFARLFGGPVSGPKRLERGFQNWRGDLIGRAINRCLRLVVGKRRRRFHQPAREPVGLPAPVFIKLDAERHTGPLNPGMQRAQIARERLGQHRHHTIRKIGRVAALFRLDIKLRAGADIMRHIGNRHPDDMPVTIRVGHGANRIVPVAGVCRVNGEERQVAQVFALVRHHRPGAFGFGFNRFGETVRYAVFVDGDQRDRFWGQSVSDAGNNARPPKAPRSPAGVLGLDQLAITRAAPALGRDQPLAVRFFIHRHDPPAKILCLINADNLLRPAPDAADQPGFIRHGLLAGPADPAQDAIADFQRRVTLFRHKKYGRSLALALPVQRLGKQVSVFILGCDMQQLHRGEAVFIAVGLAVFAQVPLGVKLAQQPFQLNPRLAFYAKGPGDLALAALGGVIFDPIKDFGFAGKMLHVVA